MISVAERLTPRGYSHRHGHLLEQRELSIATQVRAEKTEHQFEGIRVIGGTITGGKRGELLQTNLH